MTLDRSHTLLIATGSYAHAPQLNVPITAAVLRHQVFSCDAGHGEEWSIMSLFKPAPRERRNPL